MSNARAGARPSIVVLASTGILALALHALSFLAPRFAGAAPAAPRGDVLVVGGASEGGGLLLVDRHDGTRTLVSDFADPLKGPLVASASDIAVAPAGRVLVTDAGLGDVPGGLLEVARDGSRRLPSDFADPDQGPVGFPERLAVTPAG